MIDLSPCPFKCGSTRLGYDDDGAGMIVVRCDACGASGPPGRDSDEARDSWNERHMKPSPAPAYGTVRVKVTFTVGRGWVALMGTENVNIVWNDALDARPHRGEDYGHVVTLIADLPLPPAPMSIVGTVETS